MYRIPVHNQVKRTILEFCGVRPVAITEFGPVRNSKEEQRRKWLAAVTKLAEKGGERLADVMQNRGSSDSIAS